MILTVTPNPSLDRTLEFDVVRLGEVNRALDQHVEPSGKGVNVTRALAVNGIPSLAVLPLGGPEGEHLRMLLERDGTPFVAVAVSESVRVNISVVAAEGSVTKLNEAGPALRCEEVGALTEVVRQRAGGAAWIVGTGSLPPGVAADFYARLAEVAHAAGARFALDSSGDALRHGVAGNPDLVKPNREELAELVGAQLPTLGDVVRAARDVGAASGAAVLVSLGAHGAVLVGSGGVAHAQTTAAPAVCSAVGAGDNLLAGYLSRAGDRDAPVAEVPNAAALREAVAWGTVAVGARGSLAPAVTDADRRAVRVRPGPDIDLDRTLDDRR